MTGNEKLIHCLECRHCFESRRSKTGYACEMWGYDDFACSTKLTGFCHKAKPRPAHIKLRISSEDLQKLKKGEDV